MKDTEEAILKVMAMPVVVLILLAAIIPISILNAWAVQKMYGWFLLPLGLPELNLWHVWGLVMLISMFRGVDDRESKGAVKRLAIQIFGTLLVLLVGFVIKGWI